MPKQDFEGETRDSHSFQSDSIPWGFEVSLSTLTSKMDAETYNQSQGMSNKNARSNQSPPLIDFLGICKS